MRRKLFLFCFAISGALVALLHTAGVRLFLYWKNEWFDWPVHFAAGFFTGMAALFACRGILGLQGDKREFITVLAMLLAVGLAWEYFEVWAHVADMNDPRYLLDTAHDILMDLSGGSLAYFTFRGLLTARE